MGLQFQHLPSLYVYILILLVCMLGGASWWISRERLSGVGLLLKTLVVISLILVIAGPFLESTETSSRAVLLLDISDSMDEGVAEKLLGRARQFAAENIEIELYPFSGDLSLVGVSLDNVSSFRSAKNGFSKLDIGTTNLEGAVNGLSSSGGASILLISDGHETKGNVLNDLEQLRLSGSKIYPLVPENAHQQKPKLRISKLHAPLVAPAKKSVEIRVSVTNSNPTAKAGRLRIVHGEKEVFREDVYVEAGRELLVTAESDPSIEGIREITATLDPIDPAFAPSAETVYLSGEKREKVLLVSGTASDERILVNSLKDQAYQVEALTGSRRAGALPDFTDFSVVAFNNVPNSQIPDGTLKRLEQYVSSGGSFLMLGGNRSFGLGEYRGTDVEKILPVELLPPQTVKKRLNVGVVLVLDKSQSMKRNSKLEYAKEAAREVVRNLKDEDYVGVIGFDSIPFTVVELVRVGEKRGYAIERIGRLFPARKTNLFPAVDEARRNLSRAPVGRKHMIILTDGRIPDAGPNGHLYRELVRQSRLAGITISSVMLGAETDVRLLKDMADLGGGSFYRTTNARNLPRIFLSDIQVSTGERTMKERQEYLVRKGPAKLRSTEVRSFPPLRGYVQTRRKNRADLELVVLSGDKAEPLLASWSYGEGKSTAFTSDANGRWSSQWVRWQKFEKFWSEIFDSLRPESGEIGDQVKFDLRYFLEGGELTLDLAVYKEGLSGDIAAEVEFPDNSKQTVNFRKIALGRYQAKVEDVLAGKYVVRPTIGAREVTPVAFHLSGELFGERKGEGFHTPVLEALASASGGAVNPTTEDVKQQSYELTKREDLTSLFVWLALLLFCAEVFRREILRGQALLLYLQRTAARVR